MSTRPTRRAAAKRKQIIEEDSDDEINKSPSPPAEEDSEDDFTPAPPKSASRKSVGVARTRRQTTQPPAQTETPPSASSAARRPGRARKSVARDTATAEPSGTTSADTTQLDPDQTITPTGSTARRRGRPRKNVIKEETVEPETISAPPAKPAEPVESEVQPSIEPKEQDEQDENAEPNDTAMDVDEPEPEPAPKKKAPARKRKSVAPAAAAAQAKSPTPARPTPARDLEPPASSGPVSTPKPSAEPDPERFQTPLADITDAAGNEQRRPIEDTVLLNTVKPIKPLDTIMDKPMDIVLKSRTMVIPQVEDTTPKPRLVITYLILNNFKSYAGRQEVGPFHASFSSVVGPNGSGKSNVIDSLLFVFGFRASKMRQGKLSALIHSSAQYPNLDSCEVAVHFQEVLDQVCNVGSPT